MSDTKRQTIGRYVRQDMLAKNAAEDAHEIILHGSYGNLLFDPRWKTKRAAIVSRDSNRCVICENTDELQVHHRQYHFIKSAHAFKMPWDYADDLMITLCKSCHQRGHAKFKVPIITLY